MSLNNRQSILQHFAYLLQDFKIKDTLTSYNTFTDITNEYKPNDIFTIGKLDDTAIAVETSNNQIITVNEGKTKPIKKPDMPNVNISLSESKMSDLEQKLQNDAQNLQTIEEIKSYLEKSTFCDIKTLAKNTVLSDGAKNADVMLIGEAPGEEEDENGIPFCGRSGRLLANVLASIGLNRETNLYITNTLFWRPPANRKPSKIEIEMCRPFVIRQIEIIKPKFLILCGAIAMESILMKDVKISDMRGEILDSKIPNTSLKDIKVTAIYHPSYLLRNPIAKKIMWQDCIKIKGSL